MKADKYRQIVEQLYQHFLHFRKGDTVAWGEIERVMNMGRDDLGKVDLGSWVVPEFRTVLGRCIAWGVTGAFA